MEDLSNYRLWLATIVYQRGCGMKLFLIALWAFLKAHPNATFDEFHLAAERARRLTGWPE
jgi:hypothetical protein